MQARKNGMKGLYGGRMVVNGQPDVSGHCRRQIWRIKRPPDLAPDFHRPSDATPSADQIAGGFHRRLRPDNPSSVSNGRLSSQDAYLIGFLACLRVEAHALYWDQWLDIYTQIQFQIVACQRGKTSDHRRLRFQWIWRRIFESKIGATGA